MSVFNQNRGRVVQIIFASVFLVIAGQLVNLQLFSEKYKLAAENNAIFRKTIYPDRGIIFDRKHRAILENTISYDLVVIPSEAKGLDTASFCSLMNISADDYKKRMRDIIFRTGYVHTGVFEAILSPEMYARLNENIYKYPGFSLSERSVRSYPYHAAGHVLGYIAEVDSPFLRRHHDEGYQMGDYAGFTGLERTYEKVLMGQRGVKNYIRDNRSRIQGSYENGRYDTPAIAGKNIHLSLDVELQKYGEKLMANKVGSIVAIDPQTGGILCMISAPSYDPNYLTGNQRSRHFMDLFNDPRKPFNNRALGNTYSPGSTFKTVVGIIGLTEGVIDERTTVTCPGYFTGCGTGKPKCLDKGTFQFKDAVAHSDNTYFSTVFKRTIDQARYHGADSALDVFNSYARTFGLGQKLGIDLPSEKTGLLPTSAYYDKRYSGHFNSCTIISNAIGQGEVLTTLLQLANVMCIIANKGAYYTPHFVDSIEGGDESHLLEAFHERHHTDRRIPDTIFDAVQDGMQAVVDYGTAVRSHIPGIVMCGKTGTVENYARINGRTEKLQDHSFFGAFAPRGKPKIAIAVICENAGQGAWAAAPIASLMVEKYLRDSIAGPERKAFEKEFMEKNLIPQYMRDEMAQMAQRDSAKQARENREQQRMNRESTDSSEEEENVLPDQEKAPKKSVPLKQKDTRIAGILPNENRNRKTPGLSR